MSVSWALPTGAPSCPLPPAATSRSEARFRPLRSLLPGQGVGALGHFIRLEGYVPGRELPVTVPSIRLPSGLIIGAGPAASPSPSCVLPGEGHPISWLTSHRAVWGSAVREGRAPSSYGHSRAGPSLSPGGPVLH